VDPRAGSAPLTDDFADAWPGVHEPLRRYLASLGASRHEIDDIAQEVAARAIAHRVPFRDAPDLRRWAFVVARRLWIDELRTRRRIAPLDAATALADTAQGDSLGRVEDRHLLATVAAAVAGMPDRDAHALAAQPASGASRAERTRVAVARHRARHRLRRIVGPFAVIPAWWRRRRLPRSRMLAAALPAWAATVAAVFVLNVPTGSAAEPRSPGEPDPNGAAHPAATARPAPTARPSPGLPATRAAARPASPSRRTLLTMPGPSGTLARAWTRPNDGRQPLVCTRGTIVKNACVTAPQPPLPISPPPTSTAAPFSG
jgi:DNA-directed RNA polymerase specialized sigma24 family protein